MVVEVKNPPALQETWDTGSIPGSARFHGGGNGNPIQHSCLKNPWREEPVRIQSVGSQSWIWLKRLSIYAKGTELEKTGRAWGQYRSQACEKRGKGGLERRGSGNGSGLRKNLAMLMVPIGAKVPTLVSLAFLDFGGKQWGECGFRIYAWALKALPNYGSWKVFKGDAHWWHCLLISQPSAGNSSSFIGWNIYYKTGKESRLHYEGPEMSI